MDDDELINPIQQQQEEEDVAVAVLLIEPRVLECLICDAQLFTPIFQCEKGHIVCSSCQSKEKRKCPFCCIPIRISNNRCQGLEKFIKSITWISCRFAKHGCKRKMPYSKKVEHEQLCLYATSSCPYPSCYDFHSFNNLYIHFAIKHAASTTRFTYDTNFSVSIETNQKHMFFQEQHESVIFILNQQVREQGRAFYVYCVGPGILKTSFIYQLTAKSMETSISFQSVPEMFTEWSKDAPKKNYLIVPSGLADHNGILSLSVCIKKSCISSEFEEEAEEDADVDDGNSDGALQVVLNNTGVFNCSICLDPLFTPVFQCKKGHIVCSSCCSKVEKKCHLCFPTSCNYNRCEGLEKVIESVRISCNNARYGCHKTMLYHKKSPHENRWCKFALCFCPHPSCPFAGTYADLYHHFGIQHAASTTRFTYNTTFSICVDINQKHIFLQGLHDGTIFILNHEVQEHGRAFNVDCVTPNAFNKSWIYQLSAKSMETSRTLKSVPEIYTKWSRHSLTKNYLTIPSDFLDYNGLLSVFICITKGSEAMKWILVGGK